MHLLSAVSYIFTVTHSLIFVVDSIFFLFFQELAYHPPLSFVFLTNWPLIFTLSFAKLDSYEISTSPSVSAEVGSAHSSLLISVGVFFFRIHLIRLSVTVWTSYLRFVLIRDIKKFKMLSYNSSLIILWKEMLKLFKNEKKSWKTFE